MKAMLKAVIALTRRNDMTHDEFVAWWLGDHAPAYDAPSRKTRDAIVTRLPVTETPSARRHGRPVRAFFIVLGTIFLGLGALGLVLPVLPTTPFVLLAAACYLRASERLHRWLVTSRTFGPTILAWQDHGAIPPRAKAIAIALIALTFGLSVLFVIEPPLVRAGLVALGIVLVVWLARRPSPPEEVSAPRRISD